MCVAGGSTMSFVGPAYAACSLRPCSAPTTSSSAAITNTTGPWNAVSAFRKVTYLEPEQPVGFFQLGTALEHSGDRREARRAFAAAESALARSDPAATLPGLQGYTAAGRGKALAARVGARGRARGRRGEASGSGIGRKLWK